MDDQGKLRKEDALKNAEVNVGDNDILLQATKESIDICSTMPIVDNYCEAALQYVVCFSEQFEKLGLYPLNEHK